MYLSKCQVPLVEQELPTLPEHISSPPFLSDVQVIQIHVFSCLVLCCDIRYYFRVNTMFDSFLFPFCRGFMTHLWYLYLFIYTGVQHGSRIGWWCSRHLTVIRRMSLAGRNCSTFRSTSFHPPFFSVGFVLLHLVFTA